ncbi:MAG: hypothetical protein QOH58_2254 [Thermoleophilaceae bacterium]|jgi:uncharacterized protein|nr:hypothetical protein [Thermoleophilaceae bacterium]
MKKTIAMTASVAALALPATAGAHVTLQPSEVPAGGFTRLDVRVPNERDNAATTKVDLQLPPGFESVSYEPAPGWGVKVTRRGKDVGRITWTGDGRTGIIEPGEFQDFGLSLAVPDRPGEALTFKALQTYDSGEVVRWIGAPDSDEPAPQVRLAGAEASGPGAPAPADEDDGAPVWLAVAALALGALGLLAGAAGLLAGRRRAA